MTFFPDLAAYGRFALGLPGFLRSPITAGEARALLARRLAARDATFLEFVARAVFAYPASPYRRLFAAAGCELGDVEHMVRNHGLEPALGKLQASGVGLTFEEFKGRAPIVRNGAVIKTGPRDFNNPLVRRHYRAGTGGTTGTPLRVPIDLDHLADRATQVAVAYAAYGVLDGPCAVWRGILPDSSGIGNMLRGARIGAMPRKWFSPVTTRDVRRSWKNRAATEGILLISRLAGVPIPRPEAVSFDSAVTIARWAAETRDRVGGCLLRAHVSAALRVCLAAKDAGLNLSGVTIIGGGEPPTEAKVRQIAASGARWIPTYTFVEAGQVGTGCVRPVDGNDLHFSADSLALVQHTRRVPGTSIDVPAFCFTSLLPSSPKVLINVESDDYGLVESRRCGCPLEEIGLGTHLRMVRSYRKLTGEGVTLVGSEMVRILEEVLPARFGGSPLDYQLIEEEDDRGFTRLSLVISPRVQVNDEGAVRDAVLAALAGGSDAADAARSLWTQAGTLRVKRMEPVWTARGKLMPLHLASEPQEDR
jgi:hypothetical protein